MPNFRTKNDLFIWVLLDWNLKRILSYLKSASLNLSTCKILGKKQKCLNLVPKMPYLGIFGLEFENSIVIFEISTLEFIKLQNLEEKQKRLTLGPKLTYLFGYFLTGV